MRIIIIIKVNNLFILEMHREAIYRWLFFMHWKLVCMPASLAGTNITTIDILLDLINNLVTIAIHLESAEVMAFIDVLVNVLDGFNRGTDFNIDVAVVLGSKIRVVGDDTTVVKDMTLVICIGATIIGPGIFRVTIITKGGLSAKAFWEVLATLSIDHAGSLLCFPSLRTTGTMHHALCDCFIEHWMQLSIRKLSRNQGIDGSSIMNLVGLLEENKKMHMRQTTLLEFDSIDHGSHLAKYAISDIFQQSLHLLMENTCDDIWTIRG